MADANYVLLEKITVGAAGAGSVTFTNIPQTGYTDLVLKMSTRSAANVNGSAYGMGMTINGVGTNRSWRRLEGYDGTSVSSDSNTNDMSAVVQGNATTASTFNNVEIYFPNYSGSTNKSFTVDGVNENNSTTGNDLYFFAGLWSQTAGITSIGFYDRNGSSNFLANSTFYLYGVAKLGTTPAIVPYATGGDEIMVIGSYWYHIFQSSGTFTPQKSLNAQIMCVGGGGGGGGNIAAGGGAGALTTFATTSSLAASTGYTVTVGALGAGGGSNVDGSNGGTTSFAGSGFTTITALGGGGGGSAGRGGLAGGSGGGGSPQNPPSSGGTASGPNTFAGGTGLWNGGSNYASGGGGGATAVGANGSGTTGGNGGAGYTLTSIDSNLTSANINSFAGMTVVASGGGGAGVNTGGGGTGGTGGTGAGNGAGGVNTSGGAATSFGSGGGGGSWANPGTANGGNGRSGVVVIRYAV